MHLLSKAFKPKHARDREIIFLVGLVALLGVDFIFWLLKSRVLYSFCFFRILTVFTIFSVCENRSLALSKLVRAVPRAIYTSE